MYRKTIAIVTLGVLAALTHAAAQTSFEYTQDFTGPDGSFPADWWDASRGTFSRPIVEIRDNKLYLERTATHAATRNAIYNGEGSANWADYTVSATFINSTSNNRSGLIARWQQGATLETGELKGYLATTFDDKIYISINSASNGGFNHEGYLLAEANLTQSLAANQAAYMTFAVYGTLLTANLYIESSPGTFDELIGTVSVNNSAYASGSAGVMTRFTAANRSTTWDGFTVSGNTIPEPATTAILLGGIICGLIYFKRRRNKA